MTCCPTCGAEKQEPLEVERVLDAVCAHYGVTRGHLVAHYRPYARQRQVAVYLLREHGGLRWQDIARTLRRHHATVQSSHARIVDLVATDRQTRWHVARIERRLGLCQD